ncbi:MAG TPA: imidazoleglycerol-phosphate dehydratase HisB [Candidatus Omnitrophota bacterium]|nr:imidazoleglycerol-phosphate dehydratase HisB [Candidatus Omnitrophota bacterium]
MAKLVTVKRKTSETDISISLDLYGKGKYDIKTGISFLDHMLSLFARHGLFDLNINAKGDLDVDIHHTNEDVAITLGEVFSKCLKNRSGIKRFGEATVPMDEALVRVAVDVSGRPFLKFDIDKIKAKDITGYSLNYAEQFLRAFVTNTGTTIHVDVLEGKDQHHILEAVFKALAKSLMRAVEKEPRSRSIPSTKGRI